jgi:ribosomal protein S27AE
MSVHSVAHGAVIPQPIVKCRVCDEDKAPSEFYKMQIRKSRDVGECKECTKARVKVRARTDPKVQAYERFRAKQSHRLEHTRRTSDKWNAKNPLAYKAHYLVSNAVRDGRLKRLPCEFCGETKVHAHHKDYAKPLEVIWLCPKCHHRLHAMFPEIEGANKS